MNFIDLLKYIFLGAVQGLTEALPISSSGHLMIAKEALNMNVDFDTLAIITNFGSLIAVLLVFRKDLFTLITSFFKYLSSKEEKYKNDFKYCFLIVIGCIPAGIVGVLVKKLDILSSIEDSIKIVGLSLLITAFLLFSIRKFEGKKEQKDMTIKEALIVGLFQIIGIFPGISRSGSTIVGGMVGNLKRDTAFKFSFMLYIPISLGAMLIETKDLLNTNISKEVWIYYIAATIVAGILTGLVIKWFRKIVNEGKLIGFVYYCILAGLAIILFL